MAKCKAFPSKATFFQRIKARKALMRIISHTTENMFDLHVYECPNKSIPRHWHVGHISYFEKSQARIQPTVSQAGN